MGQDLEPTPSPPLPGFWATSLGHLAHIPGALGAIGRLIGKAAQLGEAWIDIPVAAGQRRAQAIRDDQAARTAMLLIIQEAAGSQAVQDPKLLARAVSSFVDDRLRKQTNREAIAEKTMEDLTQTPPPEDAKTPPDDWMNVFESHAERASSDELRSLWAKVLAGELRKNGSFSLRTLQFVSILDAPLAKEIELIATFVVNHIIVPAIPCLNGGAEYRAIMNAVSTGILANQSIQKSTISPGSMFMLLGKSHLMTSVTEESINMEIIGYPLTKLGMEIFGLLEAKADSRLIEHYRSSPGQFGPNAQILKIDGSPD